MTPSEMPGESSRKLTVSVIICAYTLERWEQMKEALASVVRQELAPLEVFLCIDHNDALYERCLEELRR